MHPCYVESSKTINDHTVSLEKFRAWLKINLKKRKRMSYNEAIKYADFNT